VRNNKEEAAVPALSLSIFGLKMVVPLASQRAKPGG